MNLSDITKINFGSAGISAVYNGGIKLWPKGSELSNKVMKFTIVSGDTWKKTKISAYTADNRLVEPVLKDATGWTYDENVEYLSSDYSSSNNLLTFEGFPKSVKIKSAESLFNGCYNCSDISFINMDFSECTNMSNMFRDCSGLLSLDLSNFNTSQVTSMGGMFTSCSGLVSLDLSNFNTSQVTSIEDMFSHCYNLASLDLSNWNTSKVVYKSGMFTFDKKLKTVKMTNCSQDTKDKIRAALDAAGLTNTVITE